MHPANISCTEQGGEERRTRLFWANKGVNYLAAANTKNTILNIDVCERKRERD